VQARYHDGLTAAAHTVDVSVGPHELTFDLAGEPHAWPLSEIEQEPVGATVRLARPRRGSARMMVDSAEWAAATQGWRQASPRSLGRESRLILGLTAIAAAVGGVVFVGVPLASGPLAQRTPVEFERRMGRNFEGQLGVAFPACKGADGQRALAAFGHRLQARSQSAFDLDVRAVEAPMVNAFALPGGAILVTGDLIGLAKSPDELSAVIAHEAAHVERRHVMQAVWRSLGFGLILDAVVGGGTGAGQQAVLLAGSFTDLRYSRDAEAEADVRGQALLAAEGLSSQGMAPFFQRLAAKSEGRDAATVKELISSHPDTLRRASQSRARGRPGLPAFSADEWRAIKAACKGGPSLRRRLRL
jgi:Zn-dependent protease with chaperone function